MKCDNTPCDAPATREARTDKGQELHFCQLCAEAFQWGQARPEATWVALDCPVDCVQEWCVDRDYGAIIWVEAFTTAEACQTVEDLRYTTVSGALSSDGQEMDDD